jgi:iron complex transport system substrate-binding protein
VIPHPPRKLLALALAGATLLVAACGGDDDDADEPAATAAPAATEAPSEATDPATTDATDAPPDTTPATDAPEGTAATAPAGDTVTIVDAQNRTVEVPRDPETVVVLDWSVIRTLTDFGIEVDATPQSNGTLPDDLAPVAEAATAVGTLFEPDYEAISALEPDLIIVGSRSGTPEVVAEMERITPTVIDMSVRYDEAQDQFPQFYERVEQLATIFGVEDEAAARLDAIRQDIEQLAADAAATGRSALFVQVSGGTVNAYGPGSRFGIVYDDFGYAPTDAPIDEEGSHGQEISQEFFVQYNPGVIFVLDRSKAIGEDATPALEVLDNGLVDTTDAAKEGRIVEVDGFAWYIATYAPSSVEQMIEDARAGL